MRSFWAMCWVLFWLAVVGVVAWLLGLGDLVRASLSAGHLLDWVIGFLCFLWLLVILKAPWDIYFQAHEVAFELQRSQERRIAIAPGREEYIRRLKWRLLWLAIGAHVLSAALVAAVAYFARREVGYYFAAFYLVSTAFRPAAAGYVYLTRKLRAIGEEVRYPREDVKEMRMQVHLHEEKLRVLSEQVEHMWQNLEREAAARDSVDRELRQNIHAISREFETTVSRLTDNQEVLRGIQAFVRLIAQSSQP